TSKRKLLPKTGDSLVYVITLLGTASLLVYILLLTKSKKESYRFEELEFIKSR
ncbi:LPXTG cell wall anchor domain-containing protein, partial [Streptococcus pyogenes]|uniref:LPXTG cell wall anchor domain-containing protein n=1 Tax=Streptococcus pyogenes TaxID=1314 RepID=UPI0011E67236